MSSDTYPEEDRRRVLNRRISRRGALAVSGSAAFLAACGGGDSKEAAKPVTTSAPSSSSSSAPAATAAASSSGGAVTPAAAAQAVAAQGKPGGTFRYPLEGTSSGDPPTLFPWENLTYLAQNPAALHYSRLIRGASGPGIGSTDTTKMVGDMAVGMPEQPDPVTYVFKMRPNVKFHDKAPLAGRTVTAQDVVKSYEAFLKISQNAAQYSDVIDKMEAPDNNTVKITLKDPFAAFLIVLMSSAEGFWFIPVETVENGQVQKDPVGAGPYVFRQWETGVAMRWDKHPSFHEAPFPYYARVEATLLRDPQRIIAGLQAGELDFSLLAASLYEDAKKKLDPKGMEVFNQVPAIGGFFFNFDNKPWGDKRVRQALSMSLDRNGYLKVQDQTGKGNWSSHIGAAHDPFYMSPRDNASEFGPNAKYYQKDITEAKKLLAAAGFPDGFTFKLSANVDRYGATAKQAWELFQQTISEAGFKAELNYQDYGSYIQTTYLGKIAEGCAVGPLHGYMRDPDQLVHTSYWSKSARHQWGGTPIPEQADLDTRFQKARRELNEGERVKQVKEIQRVMADSMLVVPYHTSPEFSWVQPWVQNYHHKVGYAIHAETLARTWFTDDRIKKG